MTHQPCLSPSGGHRGQFVLGDNRFGSAAVTDRNDQRNPPPRRGPIGGSTARPAARPIVGAVMMQTTMIPHIGDRQDQ